MNYDGREWLNITGGLVALGLVGLLGFALYALVAFDVRPTNHDILLVVITFLTTKAGTVVDFFYGGSATNKKQADVIATLADTAKTAGVALTGQPSDTLTVPAGQSAKVDAGAADVKITTGDATP